MKMSKSLAVVAALGMFVAAGAHDLWVTGENGAKFSADIGYGHGFPKPEKIEDKRVGLFEPLYVVDKSGAKTVLKQTGENYHYEGAKLKKGSYVLAADYKATFWSKDKDGKWHQDGHKENVQNVESCGFYGRTAKSVIVEGGAVEDFIYKPIGQITEIVPLSDVTKIKVGEPFKLQFFANGKPIKLAKMTGVIEGFPEGKFTFLGAADLQGVVEVIAIKEGNWLFQAKHEMPYEDTKKCDKSELDASLVIKVNK